jgi:hypothetical protein
LAERYYHLSRELQTANRSIAMHDDEENLPGTSTSTIAQLWCLSWINLKTQKYKHVHSKHAREIPVSHKCLAETLFWQLQHLTNIYIYIYILQVQLLQVSFV